MLGSLPLLNPPPGVRPFASGINQPMQYVKLGEFNVNNNRVVGQVLAKKAIPQSSLSVRQNGQLNRKLF